MPWISSSQTLQINNFYHSFTCCLKNLPSNKQKDPHFSKFSQGHQLDRCKVFLFHAECIFIKYLFRHVKWISNKARNKVYNKLLSITYAVNGLIINSSCGNIKWRHENANKYRCNACWSGRCNKPVAIGHCSIYKSFRIGKTCQLTTTTNSHPKNLTTGSTI